MDSLLFAQEMLLDDDVLNVAFAMQEAGRRMWPLVSSVENISITALQNVAVLSTTAYSVSLVAYNGILLSRAVEEILDTINVDWRNLQAKVPDSYVYKSEVSLQQIRLFPTPTVDGLLQVIFLTQPVPARAAWHDIYLGLSIVEQLATADVLHSRPQLSQLMQQFKVLIQNEIRHRNPRGSRQ